MIPTLMTVPHTASHSALAIFEQHFTRHYFAEDIQADNPFRFAHLDSERVRDYWHLYAGEPLVMTLVEPLQNIRSHLKRGKELDDAWRNWWRGFWMLEPLAFILCMDADDRDVQLKVLGSLLGVEFRPDWEKRGTWQGKSPPVERGMSESEALQFLRQFPFERYGYEI